MDFQQPHGYMRQPPPPPPPPPLQQMSMPADPYQHQSQRFPVPPPNPWYSTQFHYQHTSPSPPPPPPPNHVPHQQWAPAHPHSDHYAPPPPPPAPYPAPAPYAAHHPAPHNQYPAPPPPPPAHPHQLPPLPPRPQVPPPQVPHSYPQVNQDWGNANWSHHQSWEFQANNNEEVWAAKARAWAAAKVASDSQQTQHLQYPTKEGSLAADSTALYHGRDSSISPSVHQQEVPSSYSSSAGDTGRSIDHMAAMPSDYAFAPPAEPPLVYPSVPAVLPSGPQVDPSAVLPSPVPGHSAPIFGRMAGSSFQGTVSSVNAPFGIGAVPELHPITTFPGDSYGVSAISERPKKASVPNWLREEIIKKKPAIVSSAQDLQKEDAQSTEDEVGDRSYRKGNQADSKSIVSSRSTEDEDDDEDEVEAARAAAINQEIKRVLTEVLLKVTDELFDEIATKVLNEDDSAAEVDRIAATSDHKATTSAPPVPSSIASVKVLLPIKDQENNSDSASENSASIPPANVLGLANYASEDDDEDGEIQSSERFQKENTLLQQSASRKFLKGMDVVGNGNSQGETREDLANHVTTESVPSISTSNVSAVNDSALITESDKKRASRLPENQGFNLSSKVDGEIENVQIGLSDSKKKTEKLVDDLISQNLGDDDSLDQETRNTLNKNDRCKDESNFGGKEQKTKELDIDKERTHERGSESHSRHDERHKKERKMDQNGSKDRVKEKATKSAEKAKDSGSRKRLSPDFVKEGRKERQTDKSASGKEESVRKREKERERERERDDKREKIHHTNASESRRHKRHRSSSVSSKGRDNKDGSGTSDSSNESSDNSKRRSHSRRDKSASTTRSKKRQVSRSPHSKHSQRRHSPPYPSLESSRGRRSRSRSPVRRRR